MPDNKRNASKRGIGAMGPGEQQETMDERSRVAHEEDVTPGADASDMNSANSRSEPVSNSRKEERRRASKGYENWGGYQGY